MPLVKLSLWSLEVRLVTGYIKMKKNNKKDDKD